MAELLEMVLCASWWWDSEMLMILLINFQLKELSGSSGAGYDSSQYMWHPEAHFGNQSPSAKPNLIHTNKLHYLQWAT